MIFTKDIDIAKGIKIRFIKSWLDVLFLNDLTEKPLQSGYDLLLLESKRFGEGLSARSVYNRLSQLEEKGLVVSSLVNGFTVYTLSVAGQEVLVSFKTNMFRARVALFTKMCIGENFLNAPFVFRVESE